MGNNELYTRALAFATEKHKGQTRFDKKTPYIIHPVGVAYILRRKGYAKNIQIAALLHDVIEDCGVSRTQLEIMFNKEIAEIVDTLSRKVIDGKKEPYLDYVLRVRDSVMAIPVKIADLEHNMSDLRPGSMKDKYEMARFILES